MMSVIASAAQLARSNHGHTVSSFARAGAVEGLEGELTMISVFDPQRSQQLRS
jgi:hypothetical protein